MQRVLRLGVALGILLLAPPPALTQDTSPLDPNRVFIDGRKNPELIPQWVAWGFAFRIFDTGSKQMRVHVLRIATAEERDLIFAEAAADVRRDAACRERIEREIRPLLVAKVPPEEGKGREQAIKVECRWQTLHARDRLLAHLRPEVAAELSRFVEDNKNGQSMSLPKDALAFYRQPQ